MRLIFPFLFFKFSFDSYGENPNLFISATTEKKKKSNIVIPVAASVGGFLLLSLLISGAIFWIKTKQRKQGKTKMHNHFSSKWIQIRINWICDFLRSSVWRSKTMGLNQKILFIFRYLENYKQFRAAAWSRWLRKSLLWPDRWHRSSR